MTNVEMQKTMQFIVEQQAATAVKLDRLSERVDAVTITQERSEKKWEKTEEGIRALLSIAEIHQSEIVSLTDGVQKLTQEIQNLGETTRNTDERLNALTNIVERQISEGRNGKS